MTVMTNRFAQKYVYAVIQSRKEVSFGSIGPKNAEVYTIHYKDLAAVVSDTEKLAFNILKDGLTHQKVNEAVIKRYSSIPFRFGMTPRDENDIKGFLSKYYLKFKGIFTKIDGKMEFGLKGYLTQEYVDSKIQAFKSKNQVDVLNRKLKHNPQDAYRLKIDFGKLVADSITRQGEQIAEEAYKLLSPIATETIKNEVLTHKMFLNAAFLVERQKEAELDSAVDLVQERFKNQIQLTYIGPCPPYNFVKLEL